MQIHPDLYYAPSNLGGKGMFCNKNLGENEAIEIVPVLVLDHSDKLKIHETKLHDYYFIWGEDESHCAIALGYGSLYNHSTDPNAHYEMDFENETIAFFAIKEILAGEEITINYHGEPGQVGDLWF
jgi:uncharacterized protein